MIRTAFYRFKEFFRVPFYIRPQSYRVTLDLFLENRGDVLVTAEGIIPIPQGSGAQHVEEESFSTSVEFFHDSRFGNRVGVWKEVVPAGGRAALSASFLVTVSPIVRTSARVQEQRESFLRNRFFESRDAQEIACSIVPNENDEMRIARAFNGYTVNNFQYGNPIRGLYSAQAAFEKRVVDCGGFDTVFSSLCVTRGIPARIVSGFWAGHHGQEMMHAWCEFMNSAGEWVPADPSIEHLVRTGRDRTKSGRFGYVGSDRIVFSIGCDIPLPNGSSADILQHPFLLDPSGALVLTSSYAAERL